MDLFTPEEENDEGFPVEGAKMLVEIYHKYHPELKHTIYPFNHIRNAAYYGKTFITKPTKGLILEDAKRLRELGYKVSYNTDNEEWTISWE